MQFHPDAFTFTVPPIAVDRPTGISMRFIEQYDVTHDTEPTRIDVWLLVKAPGVKAPGVKPLDPRVWLCLGAAAIVANPTPLSRRGFFGLGLFRG